MIELCFFGVCLAFVAILIVIYDAHVTKERLHKLESLNRPQLFEIHPYPLRHPRSGRRLWLGQSQPLPRCDHDLIT